jgi:hypothetical protein
MRLDHIVIHIEKDPQALRALKEAANTQGYPYETERGSRGFALRSSRINIGDEYLEIVQLLRRGVKSWVPWWASSYDAGKRGAYCLFFEVEDVERAAVALKKAGVEAVGPAVLSYPALMGLLNPTAPYLIYYLPAFPGTHLQIALMQYTSPETRTAALNALQPNAQRVGVNGIRRVEVSLPDLPGSLPLLEKVFPDLQPASRGEGQDCYEAQADKARLVFNPSAAGDASLKLFTITSQRRMLGRQFRVENVEVITSGG